MNNKQKLAMLFMEMQSDIGEIFLEVEGVIDDETNERLTDLTVKIDDAMRLVADIEETEE